MNILERIVMKNGRPTWFLRRVLMSNRIGKCVFRFFFRIEMRRRNREFNKSIERFRKNPDLEGNFRKSNRR